MPSYGQVHSNVEKVSDEVVPVPPELALNVVLGSGLNAEQVVDTKRGLAIPAYTGKSFHQETRIAAYRSFIYRHMQEQYNALGGDFQFADGFGHFPGVHFEGYMAALREDAHDINRSHAFSIIGPDGAVKTHPVAGVHPLRWLDIEKAIALHLSFVSEVTEQWFVTFFRFRKFASLPLTTPIHAIMTTYSSVHPERGEMTFFRTAMPWIFSYVFFRPRPRKDFLVTTSSNDKSKLSLEFYDSSRRRLFETDVVEIPPDGTYRTTFGVNVPRGGYVHVKGRKMNVLSIDTIPRLI